MNALKKVRRLLVAFSALVIFAFSGVSCEYLQPEPGLAEVVRQVNKNCPQMIDSETRLDAVTIEQPSFLSYHYSLINIEASRVDTHQFRLAMWPGLLSTIRLSPEMEKLRDDEITIRYYYADKNKKPISVFVFRPEHYKGVSSQ